MQYTPHQVLIQAPAPVYIPQTQYGQQASIQTQGPQAINAAGGIDTHTKLEAAKGKYLCLRAIAITLSVFTLLAALAGFYPAWQEANVTFSPANGRYLPYMVAVAGCIGTIAAQLLFLFSLMSGNKLLMEGSRFLAPIIPTVFTLAWVSAAMYDRGVWRSVIPFAVAGYGYGIFHFYACTKLIKRASRIARIERRTL